MNINFTQNCSIVVTGVGVINAAGSNYEEFAENLYNSRGGINLYNEITENHDEWLGLVKSLPKLSTEFEGDYDRTTLLAFQAAIEALKTANLWHEKLMVAGERVSLLLGTSHGGRSQLDHFALSGMQNDSKEQADAVLNKGAHHYQTSTLAALLGIRGPVITLSTACSSSGTAIMHGIDLIRCGKADIVLAGGADAFSQLTLSGFRALGAVAAEPCGPFSETIGMSLGEGAAFIVLERGTNAALRNQTSLFEIYGAATTWDAYHLTTPEPSGNGMKRAIETVLNYCSIEPNSIGYISAHGTGTRANDIAETLAIRQAFGQGCEPPVSSVKSFTGHTLGASAVTGMLAAFAGMQNEWLPPTINFTGSRIGCTLNYIPNKIQHSRFKRFISLSAAFGGCNCAIVAGRPELNKEPLSFPVENNDLLITGMGVLCPFGIGEKSVFKVIEEGIDYGYMDKSGMAKVPDFNPKKMLPPGSPSRLNRITQLAIVAVEQALEQAGWSRSKRKPEAIGLMVALSRGAASNFESFLVSVCGGIWDNASPTAFPHLVMSSVGGQVASACGLKGTASTVVGESEAGLSVLGLAASSLVHSRELDAIVVLAADELSSMFFELEKTVYGDSRRIHAEGAVALVVERQESVISRKAKPLAKLTGWGQTFTTETTDKEGVCRVAYDALRQGEVSKSQLGLIVTGEDELSIQSNLNPLSSFFENNDTPEFLCTQPTGVNIKSAFSGLLSVCIAITALREKRYLRNKSAMIIAKNIYGSISAIILEKNKDGFDLQKMDAQP